MPSIIVQKYRARAHTRPSLIRWTVALAFILGLFHSFGQPDLALAQLLSPDAVTPALPPPAPFSQLTLTGKFLPSDSRESVRNVLDVTLPGTWDEQTQARVRHDLDALGYQASFELLPIAPAGNHELRITLQALRVVRRIYVSGNWPIFAREIRSYMTWRTGYRLPEGAGLLAEISKQEQELISFLQRDGYYDATVKILLDWAPEAPEQVDVFVSVKLNAGLFRLPYDIGEIRSEGFSLLSSASLRNRFYHCCLWFGRTSPKRINEDIKQLIEYYQSAGYVGVRLVKHDIRPDHNRKRIDLDLGIEERRRILLHFIGLSKVTEKDLRRPDPLTKQDIITIFRDHYVSPNELDESAYNIFRYYQSKGFFEARVGWRFRDRSANPLQVDFLIHEGPQLKVREIDFVPAAGGTALSFPQSQLSEQITTRRYPRLGLIGLGEGGFAAGAQLVRDVRKLEDFYRRAGYPQVRISVEVARSRPALQSTALLGLETAIDASADDSDLYIRFRISEGRREEVAAVEVSFVGAHSQSETQVLKALGVKPGKPYNDEDLQADKRRLVELFSAVGHPYADIDPTTSTWNADHTRVTIRWIVDEHELVRFGPIIIRGNVVTSESIIRRDLRFVTGQPYDRSKLLEGQQNLISRQIFTSVRVIPNPGETDEFQMEARQKHWSLRRNPVPILVEVTEQYDNAGAMEIGIGVSTDNLIYGSASYTWRNVAGRGLEVEARGELGVRVQSLLVRLAEPRLFSPFLRLDLRGFWRNEQTYSVGLVNSYGANALLTRSFAPTDDQGRRLPPTLSLYTRLEFTVSQILVPLLRPEGSSATQVDGDRTQSLKLSFGVIWDRRVGFEAPALWQKNFPVPTNPRMPVAGHLLSAQITGALCCAFAPFSAQGSFIAFATQAVVLRPFGPQLSAQDGWPLGMRRFNFKLNLRVNYGIPLFQPSLPVVERYFAGGDSSTRGYDADALRAEEVRAPVGPLASDAGYRVVPQGGSTRILSQLEWEFAITPRLLNWPWVGALFIDTGAVFDGWEKLRWNDVRFSVGISLLRLLTQFGALSLDYAYPLTLPGQEPLLQSEHWKKDPWYQHFPGRIHFNWGMPISL